LSEPLIPVIEILSNSLPKLTPNRKEKKPKTKHKEKRDENAKKRGFVRTTYTPN